MEKNMSLYSLSTELLEIENEIIKNDGEVSEQVEALIDRIYAELTTKTDSVVGWVQGQNDFIAAIDGRISELQELKKKTEKSLEKFGDYVITCMDRLEKVELEGDLYKVKIKTPRKVVEITNEDDIPIEYLNIKKTVTRKPDKKAIQAAIKNGKEVTGAKMSLGKRSVDFKTR